MATFADRIADHLPRPQWHEAERVSELVEAILVEARRAGASDVHFRPTAEGLELEWRIDGVLQSVATLPAAIRPNIVTRLKVLGGLLTYHTDRPQEGRLRPLEGQASAALAPGNEMRLSVVPTMFGEKAVVRLFIGSGRFRRLDDLGFPDDVRRIVGEALQETGGVLLISGPAGSGKTTTAYACLRELAGSSPPGSSDDSPSQSEHPAAPRRSLVTLEDPIEAILEGVAQSQIRPLAKFGYAEGVKALLRQDPDVLLVGEIRDAETAGVAFQASLTGHLVLTTFHAGSAAEAISRLLDMEMEPYQLRGGTLAVINQRLLRGLCACAVWSDRAEDRLGLKVDRCRLPRGCPACGETGYSGRIILAEVLLPGHTKMGRAILDRAEAPEIAARARAAGMISHQEHVLQAVGAGRTSPAEVRRSFGFVRRK